MSPELIRDRTKTCVCGQPVSKFNRGTGCPACSGKAKRQADYRARKKAGLVIAQETRVRVVDAEYAREEYAHLAPYGIRFSEVATRLGISRAQLRSNIAGKVSRSCCDGCGGVFAGSSVYCSTACRMHREPGP